VADDPYEIRIVGARRTPLRDLYHAVMRWPWSTTLAFIAMTYLAVNALFALGYLEVGGIAGEEGPSFARAYFFSVQTMGTIGYGALYPHTTAANLLVVGESLTSLILTALATGLVFAKFSRTRARVVFAARAVIGAINGVPSLMIRLGNERGNLIVDVQIRMTISITEKTAEGDLWYRNYELKPVRDRLMSLSRSWTVLHAITSDSPLFGESHESLLAKEVEIMVSVLGLDDTSMQPMFAQHRYFPQDISWNARYADVLTELPDGNLQLDLRKFHDVVT
jgi:inward rectifier potassium channel